MPKVDMLRKTWGIQQQGVYKAKVMVKLAKDTHKGNKGYTQDIRRGGENNKLS